MTVYDLLLDCAITVTTTVGFLFNVYIFISLLVSKQVNKFFSFLKVDFFSSYYIPFILVK